MIINDGTTAYSQSYNLQDIRCLADMITLHDDLQSSYNSALLQGTSLKIPIKAWEVIVNYLPSDSAGSFDLAISKNYTRLASLFCVLNRNPPGDNTGKAKLVNSSYFPGGVFNESLEYGVHLGSRRVPGNNVRGMSEAWWRLLGCLGIRDALAYSGSVDEDSYRSDQAIFATDMEKLPAVMASGENCSTGQTLFWKFKNCGSTSTDVPQRATIFAHFQSIIEIKDTVVDIYT